MVLVPVDDEDGLGVLVNPALQVRGADSEVTRQTLRGNILKLGSSKTRIILNWSFVEVEVEHFHRKNEVS